MRESIDQYRNRRSAGASKAGIDLPADGDGARRPPGADKTYPKAAVTSRGLKLGASR
jgi:hypothetical protein